jgi:hypothetical protein
LASTTSIRETVVSPTLLRRVVDEHLRGFFLLLADCASLQAILKARVA